MKTDRYTKIVLTIIAACLVWISIGGPSLVAKVHAEQPQPPQRVHIAGWIGQDAIVRYLGNVPSDQPRGLPVLVLNPM